MGDNVERYYKRNETIEKAVKAADKIIIDSSDGSEEETNYLTAEVAERLMQKALRPFSAALLKKDMDATNKES